MFKKVGLTKIILIIIIFVAVLLRLNKLSTYPALNADEAAIGYNAFSLIETGKDEHGNSWPLHFQSFNDYKPGLYVYLVLPFVKLFGLNEFSVRFPNAAIGILTVLLLYLLVKEITNRTKTVWESDRLALISSFFLAISPWHIHFSRGGWEVNIATFLMTLGIYCFVKYLNTNKNYNLLFSVMSFALSLYTYHAARIIVPLLGIGLFVFYFKELTNSKNLKRHFLYLAFFVVLMIPLIREFLGPAGLSRAAGVGLFADPGPITRINEQRGEHSNISSVLPKLVHNKPVNFSLAFIENWAKHFHGEFLFVSGEEIQRDRVPETGQMYFTDIIYLLLGLYFLLNRKLHDEGSLAIDTRTRNLILYWLMVSPVAAALTFQSPHALRAENMVIPLVLISAIGFNYLISVIGKTQKLRLLIPVLFVLSFLQFGRYVHMYYVHMAKEYPFSSQYGVKELVSYVSNNQNNFEKVIITDSYDQPYILFLFYMKYPPRNFQDSHMLTGKDIYGFSTVRNFDKYEFTSFDFDSMRDTNPKALIIGTPKEIPNYANIVEKIYGTNNFEYFRVVAN